ncbi:MAG: IS5 family transposase [Candidatus Amoebophilus sp.]
MLITNWREYNTALKQCGSFTVWITKDIENTWYASTAKDKRRGRKLKYSDNAIEMLLTLRRLFKLPLRQIEGFCRSLFKLGGISLQVPEFSRLSRRSSKALSRVKPSELKEPSYLIIDSTGLKVYGEKEWLETKHGKQYKRKVWRKLHVGINQKGLIVSRVMTNHLTDDRQCVEHLINQTDALLITEVLADRGYDSNSIYNFFESKGIKTIIPPPIRSSALKNNSKTGRD